MKYLVNMTSPDGKSKTITINAESCKTAAEIAKNRYGDVEINRVSSDDNGIDYFNEMRKYE